MLVTLRIKGLRLRCVIGLNEWERAKRQDVVLEVEFQYEDGGALRDDSVERAVDYKRITKQIIRLVEDSEFKMLEALAAAVLVQVLAEPRVMSARVEVDKPHSLRFADSVSAVVSASRQP